jgi:pimeloyl-ACP methyl ester carboxylesterase
VARVPSDAVRSIKTPTLLIIGDSDVVRPEHTVEMFRLLGGGVPGDLVGLPRAQLAVLPGTTHVTLTQRVDWLASMVGMNCAGRQVPYFRPKAVARRCDISSRVDVDNVAN